MLLPIYEKIQSSFLPFFLIYNRPEGFVYLGEATEKIVGLPCLKMRKRSGGLPFESGAVGYIPYEYSASEDIQARPEFLLCNKVQNLKEEELFSLPRTPSFKLALEDFTPDFTRSAYLDALQKIKTHLERGDCYQVNLSQKFECVLPEGFDAFEYFHYLNAKHPAPYAAYLNFGDRQILSFSPELFLKKTGKHIETRPIKGTQKRSQRPAEDEALKQALQQSSKERAELLMIVDLERNDFGKICEVGSVRVSKFYEVETYDYVHHLMASVEGRLREKVSFQKIMEATFPGGSVTGAPKKKAMEIIKNLEPHGRGIYTGALGWMDTSGDFLFNLAIRTLEIYQGKASFCVGGGIVMDSDFESEYEETLLKSRVFF
ncbi:MAG: aminodeoxychorismate synthase component I [Deltaproteobacteria bacterium]|nr:aminodeoxychorismate synthase component I [Deltaproteobacteria bacterium]